MQLLVIDTCGENFSIGLSVGDAATTFMQEGSKNRHAELLIPAIEELLSKNGAKYTDINMVVANVGPGSFTGLRVGIAAALGICAATKAKGYGITSLELRAFNVWNGNSEVTILDKTKRGQILTQSFGKDMVALSEPILFSEAEFKNYQLPKSAIIIGSMADSEPAFVAAEKLLVLTMWKIKNEKIFHQLSPCYVFEPDAKKPVLI